MKTRDLTFIALGACHHCGRQFYATNPTRRCCSDHTPDARNHDG
ncbi:hypothetical protein OVA29_05700 [Exiguobacterium sp. SL14]|nr:hypothetical protein [Exiguobacterium sp. SL14]MCY1690326.1 hypothetical protein [Exiguobacterium sp. SL14]